MHAIHAQFRHIMAESNLAGERLNLNTGMALLNIGCGTATCATESV